MFFSVRAQKVGISLWSDAKSNIEELCPGEHAQFTMCLGLSCATEVSGVVRVKQITTSSLGTKPRGLRDGTMRMAAFVSSLARELRRCSCQSSRSQSARADIREDHPPSVLALQAWPDGGAGARSCAFCVWHRDEGAAGCKQRRSALAMTKRRRDC